MGIFNKLNAFENIIDKIMPTVSLDTWKFILLIAREDIKSRNSLAHFLL